MTGNSVFLIEMTSLDIEHRIDLQRLMSSGLCSRNWVAERGMNA